MGIVRKRNGLFLRIDVATQTGKENVPYVHRPLDCRVRGNDERGGMRRAFCGSEVSVAVVESI